ncbi:MAG: hypothetical protein HY929_04890 [Euryarchaeota archaeon]|nr:hypothetical protein [Euryarchaeota archaeon]
MIKIKAREIETELQPRANEKRLKKENTADDEAEERAAEDEIDELLLRIFP